MPSQIPTTLGSYATAPTQIVRLMIASRFSGFECDQLRPSTPKQAALSRSEQRNSQDGFADEFAQNVARWRHDGTRLRVAERSLDGQMLGKRSAAARPHCRRGNGDGNITCRRLALEHAQHGGIAGALQMIDKVVDARREPISVDLHRG